MELRNESPRGARWRLKLKRAIAGVVGFALAATGAVATSSVAYAAEGDGNTINSITLSTVYDGAQVPNEFDDGANNGVVANNDVVGFRWDLNATDLTGGVFEQTLPEGWSWDPQSLGSLDSSSSAYQASYTLSPDGRTLTATVSIGSGTGNPSVVGFGVLKAIPSGAVLNGSVYEPELTASVAETQVTATTGPIEVRGAPRADIVKTRADNNKKSTFDFGDGAGAVPARYIDFPITVTDAAGKIGAIDTQLAQPFTITDSFALEAPNGFADAEFVAQVVSVSEANASVGIEQSGNSLTLTYDGFAQAPTASATVRFWVRDAEVPVDTVGAIKLKNTVAAGDGWTSTTGGPVAEEPAGNTAEGTVNRPPAHGNISRDKSIWLYTDQQGDFSITADPYRKGQPFQNVSQKEISLGSVVASRTSLRPAVDNATGQATPATNLVAYDFWNPAEQQIVDGASIYVGSNNGTAPTDAANYTLQYTSGTDTANPENNTWVDSIAAAGGVAGVSGVRIAYTAGAWVAQNGYFTVAVPLKIVAPLGASVQDHARWSFTDWQGATQTPAVTQYVNIGSYRLGLAKSSDRSSIVSGSQLAYTLTPTVQRALGAIEDVEVRQLQVVDTLPAGLVSVDTSSLQAPWQVTRSGSAESGLVLTFTYDGVVRTGDTLPEITYTATTSVQAPADSRLVNTAVVSAEGTLQPERARTATNTVTVYQAEVITEEKVVVGEEQIEVGDPQVSWEGRWFNFQTASQGESHFVDVLPYNGDARGTSFSGTAKLASAVVTDGAGNPAADGYGTLQYTTAPAADVYQAAANDDSIGWVDATGVDLASIDGITALRVVVHDFVSGAAGTGGLLVTMDVAGQRSGDRYVNTINGWLGHNGELGRSNPAEVSVVGSSISGVVWEDLNADGVRDAGEPLIPGGTVQLLDASGAVIGTAQTAADGSYLFDQLHSGEYRTVVDPASLGFAANMVVVNTYDLDGDLNSDSGPIVLAKAEQRTLVDFGYITRVSDIDLEKTGKLAGEARAGEWVDWSFTITNSGENPLTAVELIDHLDGVVDLEIQWPGAAGELEAGASAPATARYQLTQQDIDRGYVTNTATAQGLDPNETPVDDPADATVTLPEGGSLQLLKSGELTGDAAAGETVRWSFTLVNTGNVTLTGIELHDDLAGLGEIAWGEWPAEPFVLAPGEQVQATADSGLTQAQVDAGCAVNTANAQATTPGDATVPSNEATAEACFSAASSISLVKKTNGVEYDKAPGAQLTVGDKVEWSYVVTNTGATTLTDVRVDDDMEGAIAPPAGFDGVLLPGESVTFTAHGVAKLGQYHNTAVATGETPSQQGVTDDDESWYSAAAPVPLAVTGGQLAGLAGGGALLIAAGAVLWLMRRRRA